MNNLSNYLDLKFNRQEKCAILRSLLIVVGADNVVVPSEKNFLTTACSCLGLQDSRAFDDAMSMDNDVMYGYISKFQSKEKQFVKDLWFGAAQADNQVQMEEAEAITEMCLQCDISI